MLKPVEEPGAYYAAFGWAGLSGLQPGDTPTPETLWAVDGNTTLRVDAPVTLIWESPADLIFRRMISVDEDYMFTIRQSVTSQASQPVQLRPYGLIRRHGEPTDLKNFFILHEGLVRMSDGDRNFLGQSSTERICPRNDNAVFYTQFKEGVADSVDF